MGLKCLRVLSAIGLLLLLISTSAVAQMQADTNGGWLFIGGSSYLDTSVYTMNLDGSNAQPLTVSGIALKATGQPGIPSPDGRYIALFSFVSGQDKEGITLFDRTMQQFRPLVEYAPNATQFVSWSPDSQWLAFEQGDRTFTDVTIVNVETAEQRTITNIAAAQTLQSFDPAWSPDGKQIAFTANDGGLYLVNVDGSGLYNLTGDPDNRASTANWSPDGSMIAYVRKTADGYGLATIRLDGSEPTTLTQVPKGNRVGRAAWTPDSRSLVFSMYPVSSNGKLPDSPVDPGFYTIHPDGSGLSRLPGFTSDPLMIADFVAYLPPVAASTAASSASVAVAPAANAITAANAVGLQLVSAVAHRGDRGTRNVAFRPDSGAIAFADSFQVQLWDIRSNSSLMTLSFSAAVNSVALSADGSRLAVGGMDGSVGIFDVASGSLLATQKAGDGPIVVAFNSNGTILATAGKIIVFWDPGTLTLLSYLEAGGQTASRNLNDIAFNADSTRLAYAAAGGFSGVIDMTSMKLVSTYATEFNGRREQNAVTFSPDGQSIAASQFDGTATATIDLWDPASGQARFSLAGAKLQARTIAFSPDGSILAAGSWTGTIQIWDTSSGQILATLTAQNPTICALAFSPDGSTLAVWSSKGDHGTVEWWSVGAGGSDIRG